MEKSIDISTLNVTKSFASFFKNGEVEAMAKEIGFINRSSSVLTGEAFLKLCSTFVAPEKEWSLNDQCDYLDEHFDISLRKQSLDERYHENAVLFLKKCYQTILKQSMEKSHSIESSKFNGVFLTDATSFQLPSHLAEFYKSNGGDTSGSSIKIHQTIELLELSIVDIFITHGKENDNNYWKNKGCEFGINNLWISDLGYFNWDIFTQIDKASSYFLSRYKTGTALFIKNDLGAYEKLDLKFYLENIKDKMGVQSLIVYIGKAKIKSRLILEKVPETVKNQRFAKYKKSHKEQSKNGKKWEMTELKEYLCGYNLYITNAPESKLKAKDVFEIYGLRWQIELLFKIWKSILFIDKVPKMNIYRFECYLYGRLINILLSTELLSFIKRTIELEDAEIEISEYKTMKLVKKTA